MTPAQLETLRYLEPEGRELRKPPGHAYWFGDRGWRSARLTVVKLRSRGLVRIVTEPDVKRCTITPAGRAALELASSSATVRDRRTGGAV